MCLQFDAKVKTKIKILKFFDFTNNYSNPFRVGHLLGFALHIVVYYDKITAVFNIIIIQILCTLIDLLLLYSKILSQTLTPSIQVQMFQHKSQFIYLFMISKLACVTNSKERTLLAKGYLKSLCTHTVFSFHNERPTSMKDHFSLPLKISIIVPSINISILHL